MADEARIYRYVWDYANAIQLFRRLVRSWPNGKERRQATVDLIETLLTAAIHRTVLEMPGGTKVARTVLSSEAEASLAQVAHFRKVSSDVAILRDRATFEIDQHIDWPKVDTIYSVVVGGVNLYVPTVVKNLSELRNQEIRLAEHISDLVREDFTGPEALRGMGSLYLRRAEKRASDNPVADCQKAYAAFDACRILEHAFLGSGTETAITSYQRGGQSWWLRRSVRAQTPSLRTSPAGEVCFTLRHLSFSERSHYRSAISILRLEARRRRQLASCNS